MIERYVSWFCAAMPRTELALNDSIEVPVIRHALERMFTGVVKHETTPRHEVLHRLGNANFGIPAGRGDPGADRNGDTADLPVDHPTVTRVQPRPHRHTEIADAFHDLERAADPARRAVERRVEPVTGRINFDPLPAAQRVADDRVMPLGEFLPPSIAQIRHAFRGSHDVCEQDRGEHGVEVHDGTGSARTS